MTRRAPDEGVASFYLANFAGYDRFYGSLGGAIISLIFLFFSNTARVVGDEVDAEPTRVRQLVAGLPSEDQILVTLCDSKRIRILGKHRKRDLEEGRAIRERADLLRQRLPAPPRQN